MPERVLAVDPGGRSGWASATMDVNSLTDLDYGVLPRQDMSRWFAEQQRVACSLPPVAQRFDVVVVETWRPRRQNGSMDWIEGDNLLYAQHIGAIKLVAELSGCKHVPQQPKDKTPGQSYIDTTDWGKPLKEAQEGGQEQHYKDALMHLALYFATNWWTP
jgi:hypothetical protein